MYNSDVDEQIGSFVPEQPAQIDARPSLPPANPVVSVSTVRGEVIRSDQRTGTFIIKISGSIICSDGSINGYLSWYEVSDELFETLHPGTVVSATIDRFDPRDGSGSLVLKAPVSVISSDADWYLRTTDALEPALHEDL